MRPAYRGQSWLGFCALWVALVLIFFQSPGTARAQDQATSRQVTIFGILATPNDRAIDAKLRPIASQLRTLFPNHGFKLLGVETKRMSTGQSRVCDLGGGFSTQTQLLNPTDANGKAQLRFQLDQQGQIEFATIVTTPLNQLFFCDKLLPDGTRLVIGIGVRP
jgi:hypothetical protein